MAETYFDENVVPSLTGAGYTTDGLATESDVTYSDGGYCQIGNIVIVQYRFFISNYSGGTKTIATGFPNPMRQNNALYGYLSSNRGELHPYIGASGNLNLSSSSTAVPNNTTVAAQGVYLTTAPSVYIPPAFEVPVPVNLTIVPEMQSYCNIYRNNSYKLGRFVQISIILNVTQNITANATVFITDNPPVLYRDAVSPPQPNTGIVDIPSWDGHRIRATPLGITITGPIDAGQYTFSGIYIAAE